MKAIVITKEVPKKISDIININEEDYVIAVDGAFDEAYKQKIKIDLIVGDFDSLKKVKKAKKYEKVKLPQEKDETDTFLAVKEAYKKCSQVYLIGGIKGKRIEHFLANLTLFNEFPNLIILDENSQIYLLKPGKHVIKKSKYTSFFAYEDAVVTLYGFKYSLNQYDFKEYDPLGISNEVTKGYGEIEIRSGKVLVVEAK